MRYPMDKLKRVMAMAGVILVAGIWIATFLTGVLGGSKELLTALLVLSVVVPVLMYAILLVARTVSGKSAIDVIDEAMKKDSKKDSFPYRKMVYPATIPTCVQPAFTRKDPFARFSSTIRYFVLVSFIAV